MMFIFFSRIIRLTDQEKRHNYSASTPKKRHDERDKQAAGLRKICDEFLETYTVEGVTLKAEYKLI